MPRGQDADLVQAHGVRLRANPSPVGVGPSRVPSSSPSSSPIPAQAADAAFIPAGWDTKRLIDDLLSADKTPWASDADFKDVVTAPPSAGRSPEASDGGAGLGLGSDMTEEFVESEEAWLSSLERQVRSAAGRGLERRRYN